MEIIVITKEELRELIKEAVKEAIVSNKSESKPSSPATRREASHFLGVSLPTLDILLKTNQIKSFNIGRQVRINWSDLDNYINTKWK